MKSSFFKRIVEPWKKKEYECPIHSCDGILKPVNSKKSSYDWAVPIVCNHCKTLRYYCKLCIESKHRKKRIITNYVMIKSYLWRHNLSHINDIKSGDVNILRVIAKI